MKNQVKKFKPLQIINLIMGIFIIAMWFSVFIIKKGIGASSWGILKLFIAPLGVILVIIGLIFMLVGLVKKKKVVNQMIFIVISIIYAFPILMLFNIVPIKYPAKIEDVNPAITIPSPFKEPVLVGWGGDTLENNAPHVIWASERWAYDLVMEPKDNGSSNLEDYGIYGKEIYSPVDGVVVAAYDEDEDIAPNTDEFLSMAGNYVYIRVESTGTYLLLTHLQKDSVEVAVGDSVHIGKYLGRIGNSGTTSEPHLHMHHQSQDPTKTLHPTFAEGLPLYFYDAEGKSVMPEEKSIIQPNINYEK